VLEACCRSPATLQRDLKRARIVLLAAAGRSTRSIAKEVGVQPRIVSLWRHRYADQGREGLQDRPRPGKQPIYTKATDKRILKLLDKPAPEGFARWTGPCWPRRWAMLTSNMSGGSCAATRSTSRLASPGARATTRTLRPKPPMLLAFTSPRPRRPLCYAWTKSPRSRLWSERRAI
jgi:transposase